MIEQRLEDEDLQKWWNMNAMDECLEANSGWFSKAEAYEHFLKKFRLIKELSDKYGLPLSKSWGIDQSTGGIKIYD